jgi:hypothetical protein
MVEVAKFAVFSEIRVSTKQINKVWTERKILEC